MNPNCKCCRMNKAVKEKKAKYAECPGFEPKAEVKKARKAQKAKPEQTHLEDRILELRRKCLGVKDIAKALHKSDRYVSKVVRARGWSDVGTAGILRLRKLGESIRGISKKLTIGERLVSEVVMKHGM